MSDLEAWLLVGARLVLRATAPIVLRETYHASELQLDNNGRTRKAFALTMNGSLRSLAVALRFQSRSNTAIPQAMNFFFRSPCSRLGD